MVMILTAILNIIVLSIVPTIVSASIISTQGKNEPPIYRIPPATHQGHMLRSRHPVYRHHYMQPHMQPYMQPQMQPPPKSSMSGYDTFTKHDNYTQRTVSTGDKRPYLHYYQRQQELIYQSVPYIDVVLPYDRKGKRRGGRHRK